MVNLEDSVGVQDVGWELRIVVIHGALDGFSNGEVFGLSFCDGDGSSDFDEGEEFRGDVEVEADATVTTRSWVDPAGVDAVGWIVEFTPVTHGVAGAGLGDFAAFLNFSCDGPVAFGGGGACFADGASGCHESAIAFHDVDGLILEADFDPDVVRILRAVGFDVIRFSACWLGCFAGGECHCYEGNDG